MVPFLPVLLLALLFGANGNILPKTPLRYALRCPGYKVSAVEDKGSTLELDLKLAGPPCNVYGTDWKHLLLKVEYQSENRLHIIANPTNDEAYQVPDNVFPRPCTNTSYNSSNSALEFTYEKDPFSFVVKRKSNGEVLFNTTGFELIVESEYIHLQTSLPENPNLYGLGEHSDPFRLSTTNYTRTLWNRDAYGIPNGTNLYGSHPVYFEHRADKGTHGVLMLNSNGMDIKIDKTPQGNQFLEYNILGGVIDLYFMSGPSPANVSSQYAEIAGQPAMVPYWGFGFHQCRYGYRDVFNVAEVVYNYSQANIPLETMWTDIDYMDRRRVFTLDPERYPLDKMQELVNYLHEHQQHYIVMVDPAVSYSDNGAFNRGKEQDIFMKWDNGTIYKGVVWPGVTAFPDFLHPQVLDYWVNEFRLFFSPDEGVNIDGLWIDMNEAANFCDWPCDDPEGYAKKHDFPPEPPPVRPNPRPLPGFPASFQPPAQVKAARDIIHREPSKIDDIDPPFKIHNAAGSLSNKTLDIRLHHAFGLKELNTHNLYGALMSTASRESLLRRRPARRPLVITRSTFAGVGAYVGKWLGDNLSDWGHYRISIAQMLQFASIFQVPMVGSDVCGFGGNVTEKLCSRWAMLGAFYPFFRNHNDIKSISQEFYIWPGVANAARNAIDIRYRLMDYIYTAFYHQTRTGIPCINPLFYLYPEDEATFPIDLQFFYGDAILVSPVTKDNATDVEIYLPQDIFYDYYTGAPIQGEGKFVTLEDVPFDHIPLHIRGGSIIPLRVSGANTTTELRKRNFVVLVAPNAEGKASGSLYLDDGDSLVQESTTEIKFTYGNGEFRMDGDFHYKADEGVRIQNIILLGVNREQEKPVRGKYYPNYEKLVRKTNITLTEPALRQLVTKR